MSAPRPFGPDELDGVAGLAPDELAAETRLARDLEGIAARDGISASAGFADRVMGAIATEPLPAPVIAAGSALRHAALLGFLVSVRDAVRVSFSGGFPVAVRAQAFALVLLVVGLTAGSGYAAAGALGLLGDRSSPGPSVETPSLPLETAEPTSTPDATLAPTRSPEPSESAEASADPTETPEATEATDEEGGDRESATDSPSAMDNATAKPTVRPTAKPTTRPTPRPTQTPSPTPEPSDAPDSSRTPRPSASPSPSPSPTPSSTPEHG